MQRYSAYLFDLDGTLYRGSQPMPHAASTLEILRREGSRLFFLTNNSGITPQGVAEKLIAMGIEAHASEVVTSGMAAARHCLDRRYRRLFVLGEPGLVRVLRDAGLEVANADEEGRVRPDEQGLYDAVVHGICRSYSYDLLSAALQALRQGAHFIATNPDSTYPMENGRLEPGAGSLVAALRTCSGLEPHVVGKPRPDMIRMVLEQLGLPPDEALLVGDRLDTDIAAAHAAGCPSVLVLGGVTDRSDEVKAIQDLRELLA